MNLIRRRLREMELDINLGEVSRIWKGGCIIRAQFLDKIKQAYQRRPESAEPAARSGLQSMVEEAQPNWRLAVTTAMLSGVPVLGDGLQLELL